MRDEQAKRERGYKDPRSKVRPDGSEVLYGKDWTKRKQELWDRAEGRCEQLVEGSGMHLGHGAWIIRHERCRSEGHDPDHVVKRSKKRDDRLEALQLLCRLHHDLKDRKKLHWRPSHAAI